MDPASPVITDTPERIYVPLDAAPITPSNTNPLAAVKASLTDENGIIVTAVEAGEDGNDIDFSYEEGSPLSIGVVGTEIHLVIPWLGTKASSSHTFGSTFFKVDAQTNGSFANGTTVSLITPVTVEDSPLTSVITSGTAMLVSLETDSSTSALAAYTTSLTGADNDLVYTSKLLGTMGNLISVAYLAPTDDSGVTSATQNNRAITVQLAGSPVNSSLTTSLAGANNDLVFTSKIAGAIGNTISVQYLVPEDDTEETSVEVSNSEIVVTLEATYVAATLTTALTGDDNDLVFTAVEKGTAGNSVTIKYTDPAANDAPLTVNVTGTDIDVLLATNGSGDITTTAAQITSAILASVEASELVTSANAGGNDGTGVVTALTETPLSGGTVTISTTATDVKDAIEAYELADNLVTVANAAGNTGAGTVTAMAKTNLSGNGFAITSTATQVKAAIEANSETAALVTVANAGGNDGTGIVTVLTKTNLSGGLYASAVSTAAEVVTAINTTTPEFNFAGVTASVVSGSTSQVMSPHVFTLQGGTSEAPELRDIVELINTDENASELVSAYVDLKIENRPALSGPDGNLEGGFDGQWELTQNFARGFEVGVAGDVSFETFNGTVVTRSYEAGDREEIAIKGILADGTTADEILGLA